MENANNISALPVKKRRPSLFNRIVLFLNYGAAIALLISYLSPFVSPENFWFIAFFGLTYPLLVIVNLAFVVYWLILWRNYFLISFIILGAGYFQAVRFFQFNFPAPIDKTASSDIVNVLSYNVRLFDLYNWTHNKTTRNKMFELISDEAPEIMCLQEYYTDEVPYFPTLDTLVQLQPAKNYHLKYTLNEKDVYHFGIATFSAYPIINKGEVVFPEKNNNVCIYTDVKINKDTVRVYNMHLQSLHFLKADYEYIENLMHNKPAEDIENSKNIIRRLKKGFQKRAVQADIVAEHIAQCKYPVIVCGDFNDTPASYVYQTISKNLKDAFMESGIGFGKTYKGVFPSFRIDYILHSKHLESLEFNTIQEPLSDHYPISSYLRILPKE